jgi:ribosomal protein S18 acetylase RimI-like enzyme
MIFSFCIDMCRSIEEKDLSQVADVHIAAFPGFFLTSLGHSFLMVMYRSFMMSPGGVFVVDEAEGRVHGFAVGVLKSAGKDRRLAARFFVRFLLALVPAVLRNPLRVLRRITGKLIFDGGQPEIPEGAVVLRSIGVLPKKKGEGVACRLLGYFEQIARERGATSVALTTDAVNNDRAIGFYLKNGYNVQQEFMQDGSRKMLMLLKDIRFFIEDRSDSDG